MRQVLLLFPCLPLLLLLPLLPLQLLLLLLLVGKEPWACGHTCRPSRPRRLTRI